MKWVLAIFCFVSSFCLGLAKPQMGDLMQSSPLELNWTPADVDMVLGQLTKQQPDFPNENFHRLLQLLYQIGQRGKPETKAHLEKRKNTEIYEQVCQDFAVNITLEYILMPQTKRPDLCKLNNSYNGQSSPTPVTPHAVALLTPINTGSRVYLKLNKTIEKRLTDGVDSAEMTLHFQAILETQVIFYNHVETTRFSFLHTRAILQAIHLGLVQGRTMSFPLMGVSIELLDAYVSSPQASRLLPKLTALMLEEVIYK
jgi:hypothetical protein